MFSPLRNRFGIPGLISVIALVFAMLGGAYAANTSGDGATASAKKNVKKAKRGPRGPRGKQGPMGPAGPAGPAGPQGSAGAKGANGAAGTSATTASFDGIKGGCTEGGIEVKSASPVVLVCNGNKGTNGTDGTDGTFSTEPLPAGETLTGTWATASVSSNGDVQAQITAISYPIRVEPAPEVGYVNEDGTEEFFFNEELEEIDDRTPLCEGEANAPTAPEGHLCVYADEFTEGPGFMGLASVYGRNFGARLAFVLAANSSVMGSWAVTAE